MKFNFTNSMIVAMTWSGLCVEHVVSPFEVQDKHKKSAEDKQQKISGRAK